MATAVIGASGFIGSHVAKRLIDSGEEVLVVSRNAPTDPVRRQIWESADHRIITDISNGPLDLKGCSRVFNFAADMGGVGYFSRAQVAPYIENSRITFKVLEMCSAQKVDRVFMASSACAYPTTLQSTEGMAPLLSEQLLETGPADQMYGREKLMLCALAANVDFDCRVGILHTVYGDTVIGAEHRMKFPTSIAMKAIKACQSGEIRIWGNGQQLRSYLWIDDAVDKIIRVMSGENPGPINIGYQGAVSVLDVVAICCGYLNIQPTIHFESHQPSGVLSRDCSNEKFWNLYGRMEPTNTVVGYGRLVAQLLDRFS